MQIQGSNISRSYNNSTNKMKPETVVKKAEDRSNGQRTLSNNVKITNTSPAAGKKIESGYGKSSFITYSENLKKQSNGLRAAALNAKTGSDLVKTTDAALKEAETVLNRMRDITTQASSDSLSEHDRSILQSEINDLSTQINDISSSTTFNGINLLDGDGTTKVYMEEYKVTEEITESVSHTIDATFNNKGNPFYAAGGTDSISDSDAIKELEKGNNLYTDAAMSQTAYVPPENSGNGSGSAGALGENSVSYNVDFGSQKIKFTSIVVGVDSNGNGNFKNTTYKNDDSELKISDVEITVDELINKLNSHSQLSKDFVFEKNDTNDGINVIAKDATKVKMVDFKYKLNGTQTSYTQSGGGSSPVTTPDLYAYQGTEKLDKEDAKNRLANGETLYTNAYKAQTAAVKDTDYEYTPKKTVISEVTSTIEKTETRDSGAESYKTLNFNLNSDGTAKYASLRLDIMDSDSLGVSRLSVANSSDAKSSTKKIEAASEKIKKQREYLAGVGGRLNEASSVNDINAENVKTAQKIEAENSKSKSTDNTDLYAELQETILENSQKADKASIELMGGNPTE